MLVLSRKKDQKIVIEGGIVITFLGMRGEKCRIGIEAPTGVKILRDELSEGDGGEVEADMRPMRPRPTFQGGILRSGLPSRALAQVPR
mgnify:CR=1 FL=1